MTSAATSKQSCWATAIRKKHVTGSGASASIVSREAAHFLVVPAPWVKQIEEPQLAGYYPGRFSNVLEATGLEYLDPIDDFVNAHLADSLASRKEGKFPTGNTLFNGRVGDAHFSAEGCRVWAKAVGRRLELVIEKRISSQNALVHTSGRAELAPPQDTRGSSATPR